LRTKNQFVISGGNLTVTGTIEVDDAFTMTGGTLHGGVVVAGPGGAGLEVQRGTLDGVTLHCDLDLTELNAVLTVTNGLTLNGTATVGGGGVTYARIDFSGTQTLAGSGTVVFGGGPNAEYNSLREIEAGATLTIGPGITVRGSTGAIGYDQFWSGPTNVGLIHQGTVSADVSGGNITLTGQPFENQATIRASSGGQVTLVNILNRAAASVSVTGGALGFSGSWTNAGAISATDSTVTLGGSFKFEAGGTFLRSGGTVSLTGTLDTTGATLDLDATTGAMDLSDGGGFKGGTVRSGGASRLTIVRGSLDGVTLDCDLDLAGPGAVCTVSNGLTLDGTATLGGTVNEFGRMDFGETQTLAGSGTVVFGGGANGAYNALRVSAAGATLTIGPGITVRGETGGIGFVQAWGGPPNVGLINQGTISADVSGGNITVNGQPFENQGTVRAINGGQVTLVNLLNRAGASVAATGASLSFSGTWTNAGSISATDSAVTLGGSFQFLSGGTFQRSGGALNQPGMLDNTGNTLHLDATTGSLRLTGGGGLKGGTIQASGGAKLVVQIGKLDGVTLNCDVDLSGPNAVMTVTNGLVLNGTASLGGAGNQYGRIDFSGNQTLSGSGTVLFGGGSNKAFNALRVIVAATTLAIGPGITMHGDGGGIGYSTAWGGPPNVGVVNHGAITGDVSGGNIAISGQPFENQSLVRAIGGGKVTLDNLLNDAGASVLSTSGSLSFTGTWTNGGAIGATDSTVTLGGSFTLPSGGTFTRSGGTVSVSGTLDNSTATFSLNAAAGSWELVSGGGVKGGVVQASGGSHLIVVNGKLDGVTLDCDLDLSGPNAVLTVTSGLVLNGTASLGGSGTQYGRIDFSGTQTLSGSGTVVLGGGTNKVFNVLRIIVAGSTLTIGPGITLHGDGGGIGYSTAWGGPPSVGVINQGTITDDMSGGNIALSGSPFENQSQVRATGGGKVTLDRLKNDAGAGVSATGGSLTFTGAWTNAGSIDATDSTLSLGGSFKLEATSSFDRSGGTVTLAGMLDNTAAILALNAAAGSWIMLGGGVTGGTVQASGGSKLVAIDGTLDGVTLNCDLDVSGPAAVLAVTGGLVLNGTATVGGTGTQYGRIDFSGTQTLAGSGTVVFGGGTSKVFNTLRVLGAGSTLTLGPGIAVHGDSGSIGYNPSWGGPQNVAVTNQGAITADVSGGTIFIRAQPFTSTGTTGEANGGHLVINP
jgi:hypothetical protein